MKMQRIDVGGLELSVEVGEPATGAADAETVLLIHGFPDSHKLWRYQVPVLRDAGFGVGARIDLAPGDDVPQARLIARRAP